MWNIKYAAAVNQTRVLRNTTMSPDEEGLGKSVTYWQTDRHWQSGTDRQTQWCLKHYPFFTHEIKSTVTISTPSYVQKVIFYMNATTTNYPSMLHGQRKQSRLVRLLETKKTFLGLVHPVSFLTFLSLSLSSSSKQFKNHIPMILCFLGQSGWDKRVSSKSNWIYSPYPLTFLTEHFEYWIGLGSYFPDTHKYTKGWVDKFLLFKRLTEKYFQQVFHSTRDAFSSLSVF